MQLFNVFSSIIHKTGINYLIYPKRRYLHWKIKFNIIYQNQGSAVMLRIKNLMQKMNNSLNHQKPTIHMQSINLGFDTLRFSNSHNVKEKLVTGNKQGEKITNQENIGYRKDIPLKTSDYEDYTGKSYVCQKKQPQRVYVKIKNKGKQDIQKPGDTQPYQIQRSEKPVQKKNYKQQPSKKPNPNSDTGKYSYSTFLNKSIMMNNDIMITKIIKFNFANQQKQYVKDMLKKKVKQEAQQYMKVKKHYQTGEYIDQTMAEEIEDTLNENKGDFLKQGRRAVEKEDKEQNKKDQNQQNKQNNQNDSDNHDKQQAFTSPEEINKKNIDLINQPIKLQTSEGLHKEIKDFTLRNFNKILDRMDPNDFVNVKRDEVVREDFSKFNKKYRQRIDRYVVRQEDLRFNEHIHREFDNLMEKLPESNEQSEKVKEKDQQQANRTSIDLEKQKQKVEDSLPSYK